MLLFQLLCRFKIVRNKNWWDYNFTLSHDGVFTTMLALPQYTAMKFDKIHGAIVFKYYTTGSTRL